MKRLGTPRGASARIAAMAPAPTVEELQERVAELEYQLERTRAPPGRGRRSPATCAWRVVQEIRRARPVHRRRNADVMVYRCRGCGLWHLGRGRLA